MRKHSISNHAISLFQFQFTRFTLETPCGLMSISVGNGNGYAKAYAISYVIRLQMTTILADFNCKSNHFMPIIAQMGCKNLTQPILFHLGI